MTEAETTGKQASKVEAVLAPLKQQIESLPEGEQRNDLQETFTNFLQSVQELVIKYNDTSLIPIYLENFLERDFNAHNIGGKLVFLCSSTEQSISMGDLFTAMCEDANIPERRKAAEKQHPRVHTSSKPPGGVSH